VSFLHKIGYHSPLNPWRGREREGFSAKVTPNRVISQKRKRGKELKSYYEGVTLRTGFLHEARNFKPSFVGEGKGAL